MRTVTSRQIIPGREHASQLHSNARRVFSWLDVFIAAIEEHTPRMIEPVADLSSPTAAISADIPRTARTRLKAFRGALNVYDVAIVLGIVALLVSAWLTYRSYAVSNDEIVQHRYGELILDYYRSGMTDRSVFHFDNLYLYGGLFDIVAVLLAKIIHMDVYDLRHIMCAMIGIAGVVATAATARLIAGARAGLLAGLSLALCGAWYGCMFNHTKDVPFAAAMVGALYFLVRMSRDFPKPRPIHLAAFAVLTGAALGIRVLGLLTVFYTGFAILLCTPRPWPWLGAMRAHGTFVIGAGLRFIPAFALAYVIMIAAWPWAALSPLNPVHGLIDFSDFNYHIKTLLDGRVYEMSTVPRLYIPIYILIRVPLLTLAGAALALAFAVLSVKRGALAGIRRTETALVALTVAFPVLCQVAEHGPAFTGMRHFTFVLPSIAILAGIGLHLAIARLDRIHRLIAIAAVVPVIARSASNLMVLVELHPYEYLAYNEAVGGFKGAAGRYDTDYWVNIMPDAVTDLENYIARTDHTRAGRSPRSYTVAVCGERGAFEDRPHRGLRWIDDWTQADFFIAPTHMDCDSKLGGKEVAVIKRLDTRIGVVKDRRALVHPAVASAL